MLCVLRTLWISVVSVSLICSPLYSLKSFAQNSRLSQQHNASPSQQLPDHEPGVLLVKFNDEASEQNRKMVIQAASKSYERLRGQSSLVKLTLRENLDFNSALEALQQFSGIIDWVGPNPYVYRAGATRTVDFPKSRSAGQSKDKLKLPNSSTIVALIDTGVDIHHRDLRDIVWLNASEKSGLSGSDDDRNGFTDDTRGWNFINNSNDVADDNGHGTQIAGITAQSGTKLTILPLKALNRAGRGTIADVVEAMDYAIARHAAVINCSFGAPAYSRAMLDAIKRAETAGIVVVAAAGNNARNLSETSFYPASYRLPNLISVAATDRSSVLASFSNFSADIAAPGVEIRTSYPGIGEVYLTGTSAAAGFVSAAAGLLKSKRGWVSAQTIRDTILKSATQSFDLKDKVSSKGVVNPEGALSLLLRDSKDGKTNAPVTNWRMTPAIKAALQSGNGNLDAMRNSQPQAPNAYQQTGTLPSASYDDPKPTVNYDSYLTGMAGEGVGIAGSRPMQSVDPTAGSASVGGWSYNLDSRNYNFTLPVVALPGRAGLGLSLGLSYNSKVWLYDSTHNTWVFNTDRGFPGPGWHIGFGAIQVKDTSGPYFNSVTGKNSVIFVSPDGTRHDLSWNPVTSRYEAYDSSYIYFDSTQQAVYFPNGTRMQLGAYSWDTNTRDFLALPTEIRDRNGNFITVAYKTLSNQKVVIDYAIDTAGRRIDFNYQNNKLVSVSQNRNGSVFTYVYIDYQPVTIQTSFAGGATADPASINGAQVYFPSRITYPTGVNYRFNYTSYGQINAIQKWVPTITGQGNARQIAQTSFSLASYDPNNPIPYSPGFGFRYEWAANWQAENQQSYSYFYDLGSPGNHEIQDPAGRRFGVTRNGMIFSMIVYDSIHNRIKQDDATYISDSGPSYTSNPRIYQAKTTAWVGASTNIKYSNYSYLQRDGMWLVENRDDYNGNPNLLYRRTTTTYTSYPSQYILGLPQQVSVYNATNTLLSRVTNNYDQTGSYTDSNGQNAPYFIDETGVGVIQHNTSYNFGFTSRGNRTSVVQSSVVGGAVNGTRTIKYLSYDTNGNLRAEADGAGNRKQIVYTDNYSNKPASVGQTHVQGYSIADPTGFRTGSQWNYYTGQMLKTFNLVTPGSSTESQVVTKSYDFADRSLVTTRPDSGWIRTDYWDNSLAMVTSQLVDTGKIRFKFDLLDGAGRVYKKASDHPDGVGGKYSGQITVFDQLGQTEDASGVVAFSVHPTTNEWLATDGDAFLFTHLTRDDLSRLKIITFPDNNTRQFDFTGCGCAGTSETRVTDELGHYTTTKTDFLGRLVEAIEPDYIFGGDYSKAQYFYDELDRLTEIHHTNGNGTKIQTRAFSYDGYGRLQSENTPEGGIVSYTYTANDLVQTVANQRNITVTNSYNTRNLLTGVSYSDTTPGVGLKSLELATIGFNAYGSF